MQRHADVGKGRMHLRQRNRKSQKGWGLLLMIVLVVCAVLTYSRGKALEKENELKKTKASYETRLESEKERQEELKEEAAYRQTRQYWIDCGRLLGLVMPDEILIRKEETE